MSLNLSKPILYLITRGATTEKTTAQGAEFRQILLQVSSAVDAGIHLVQLREKKLTTRVLFELTERAVEISRGTRTRVVVNDRADVAAAAGAAGVHLTTRSLDAHTIRKTFGEDFVIGVSTHSAAEAHAALDAAADFVVFGPIFETDSKKEYGPPQGLEQLRRVADELTPFPVLALGGITIENAAECLRAGASGIAGISLFSKREDMYSVAAAIAESATGVVK